MPGGVDHRKKNLSIIGVSSLLLVAMVVAVTVGSKKEEKTNNAPISSSMKAVENICEPTDYKDTCVKSLSRASNGTDNPMVLIEKSFEVAMDEIRQVTQKSTLLKELQNDPKTTKAAEDCKELFNDAEDDFKRSIHQFKVLDFNQLDKILASLEVWLSATITYQETCLDGFNNISGDASGKVRKLLETSMEMSSNGLAIINGMSSAYGTLQIQTQQQTATVRHILSSSKNRRLLSSANENVNSQDDIFKDVMGPGRKAQENRLSYWRKNENMINNHEGLLPSWVDGNKRKLLEAKTHDEMKKKPNVTVAKDGSGDYKRLEEALAQIPKYNNDSFVIYVKEGVYKEYLKIEKWKTHVVLIGDGPNKTTISGNMNFIDGTPTFKTATLSVQGDHFMAKDIGFENTAGAEKHQAVALKVQSDKAIFYNCQMDGYQDTLYAHTYRQFYRDCVISGTIDFIFGDAVSFFQNCTFVVRKPMDNQNCIVTAQGRKERHQPTGIIIHKSKFISDPDYYPLRKKNMAYLGRPWKEYSKTIIMESYIDDLIQPDGWLPWMGDFGLKTCYYGEYNNRGPGANMEGRVKWPGVKTIIPSRAEKFMPPAFFQDDAWIKKSGVPYIPNLTTASPPELAALPPSVDEDPDAPAAAPRLSSDDSSSPSESSSSDKPSPSKDSPDKDKSSSSKDSSDSDKSSPSKDSSNKDESSSSKGGSSDKDKASPSKDSSNSNKSSPSDHSSDSDKSSPSEDSSNSNKSDRDNSSPSSDKSSPSKDSSDSNKSDNDKSSPSKDSPDKSSPSEDSSKSDKSSSSDDSSSSGSSKSDKSLSSSFNSSDSDKSSSSSDPLDSDKPPSPSKSSSSDESSSSKGSPSPSHESAPSESPSYAPSPSSSLDSPSSSPSLSPSPSPDSPSPSLSTSPSSSPSESENQDGESSPAATPTYAPMVSPTSTPSSSIAESPSLVLETSGKIAFPIKSSQSMVNLERELLDDKDTDDDISEVDTASEHGEVLTPSSSSDVSPISSQSVSPSISPEMGKTPSSSHNSSQSVLSLERTLMEDNDDEISKQETTSNNGKAFTLSSNSDLIPIASPSVAPEMARSTSSSRKSSHSMVNLERKLMEDDVTNESELETTSNNKKFLMSSSSPDAAPIIIPSLSPSAAPKIAKTTSSTHTKSQSMFNLERTLMEDDDMPDSELETTSDNGKVLAPSSSVNISPVSSPSLSPSVAPEIAKKYSSSHKSSHSVVRLERTLIEDDDYDGKSSDKERISNHRRAVTPSSNSDLAPITSLSLSPSVVPEMAKKTSTVDKSSQSVVNLERNLMEDDFAGDSELSVPRSNSDVAPISSPSVAPELAKTTSPSLKMSQSMVNLERTLMEDDNMDNSEVDVTSDSGSVLPISSPSSSQSIGQKPSVKSSQSAVNVERTLIEDGDYSNEASKKTSDKVKVFMQSSCPDVAPISSSSSSSSPETSKKTSFSCRMSQPAVNLERTSMEDNDMGDSELETTSDDGKVSTPSSSSDLAPISSPSVAPEMARATSSSHKSSQSTVNLERTLMEDDDTGDSDMETKSDKGEVSAPSSSLDLAPIFNPSAAPEMARANLSSRKSSQSAVNLERTLMDDDDMGESEMETTSDKGKVSTPSSGSDLAPIWSPSAVPKIALASSSSHNSLQSAVNLKRTLMENDDTGDLEMEATSDNRKVSAPSSSSDYAPISSPSVAPEMARTSSASSKSSQSAVNLERKLMEGDDMGDSEMETKSDKGTVLAPSSTSDPAPILSPSAAPEIARANLSSSKSSQSAVNLERTLMEDNNMGESDMETTSDKRKVSTPSSGSDLGPISSPSAAPEMARTNSTSRKSSQSVVNLERTLMDDNDMGESEMETTSDKGKVSAPISSSDLGPISSPSAAPEIALASSSSHNSFQSAVNLERTLMENDDTGDSEMEATSDNKKVSAPSLGSDFGPVLSPGVAPEMPRTSSSSRKSLQSAVSLERTLMEVDDMGDSEMEMTTGNGKVLAPSSSSNLAPISSPSAAPEMARASSFSRMSSESAVNLERTLMDEDDDDVGVSKMETTSDKGKVSAPSSGSDLAPISSPSAAPEMARASSFSRKSLQSAVNLERTLMENDDTGDSEMEATSDIGNVLAPSSSSDFAPILSPGAAPEMPRTSSSSHKSSQSAVNLERTLMEEDDTGDSEMETTTDNGKVLAPSSSPVLTPISSPSSSPSISPKTISLLRKDSRSVVELERTLTDKGDGNRILDLETSTGYSEVTTQISHSAQSPSPPLRPSPSPFPDLSRRKHLSTGPRTLLRDLERRLMEGEEAEVEQNDDMSGDIPDGNEHSPARVATAPLPTSKGGRPPSFGSR